MRWTYGTVRNVVFQLLTANVLTLLPACALSLPADSPAVQLGLGARRVRHW